MSLPSSPETSPQSNNLQLSSFLCDAVINVNNVEFPVHKIILCNHSKYFRKLFMRRSNRDKRDFTLSEFSSESMQLVLEWIYTGSVSLTAENVRDVLFSALTLNITDLVDFCRIFVENGICAQNCVGIWKLADAVVSEKVRQKAHRFILDHFEEVSVCEEFQLLTADELRRFIENDGLNVKTEKVVFEAVLHWINHALDERRPEFPSLLSKVRLGQMTPEFVRNNVLLHPLVQGSVSCLTVVVEAMGTVCEAATDGPPGFRDRPRLPAAFLLAIGGWGGNGPINDIEAYDYKADRWVNVTNREERPRAYHGAVFLNGSVYCVGGFDRHEHFNTVRRLDLSTRTWHEMPPMYYHRTYLSVTVLNGCVYAMGGYNGHTRLETAEFYSPQTNRWSLIAPMHMKRSDANCAALNGKIYICGGFTGNECLYSAESYCPDTDQWTLIAPMTSKRSGVSVIAHDNAIYAIGGFDEQGRLRSAEMYNPCTNSWRPVASMLTPRSNFGVGVVDDRIFAVGGFDGINTTYKVESYDPVTDRWTEARDMDIVRSALDCCVISGLPNMADYTVPRDAQPPLDIDESEEGSD